MKYATIEVPAREIKAGDTLVSFEDPSETLDVYDDAEASSTMPGLLRVENTFGTLYIDEDSTVRVIREV